MKIYLVLILCWFLVACGPKAPNDQTLTTDIQARLYANDATRAAAVKVAVSNGVATLSGDVPSSDVALQAVTAANSTPGVKGVNNQMNVTQASAAAIPPVSPPGAAPASNAPVGGAPPSAPVAPTAPAPQDLTPPAPSPSEEQKRREEMARHERERERKEHNEPAPPPKPVTVTFQPGQTVSVRMIDGIDTGRNQQGQTFRASLSAPLTSDDRVIVPAGASATVLLAQARGAGRIKGQSELELRLTSITYHGADVEVSTSDYEAKGGSRGKQSAIRTGIGAAAGALIGGLAGGGKGAGIGAAAGAGAGVGVQLLTHGQQIKIPSETEITFRLSAPLVLTRSR